MLPRLSSAQRHAAFAFWPEAWLNIAAPVERIALSEPQMIWLLQQAEQRLPTIRRGDAGLIAALAAAAPGHGPYRIMLDDLASARSLPHGPEDAAAERRVARLLARPWRACRHRLIDALDRSYEVHLSMIDETRFRPAQWRRCLIDGGKVIMARPIYGAAGSDDEMRAIAAACRVVTPALIDGAASGRYLVDLVIEDGPTGLRAGMLWAGPPKGAEAPLGLAALDRAQQSLLS